MCNISSQKSVAFLDYSSKSLCWFLTTSPPTISIKYISLLTCFLLAFSSFLQSARHFVHANYLISTPDSNIPVEHVEVAVIRGSNFGHLVSELFTLHSICYYGFLVLFPCLFPPYLWWRSSITWTKIPDLYFGISIRIVNLKGLGCKDLRRPWPSR